MPCRWSLTAEKKTGRNVHSFQNQGWEIDSTNLAFKKKTREISLKRTARLMRLLQLRLIRVGYCWCWKVQSKTRATKSGGSSLTHARWEWESGPFTHGAWRSSASLYWWLSLLLSLSLKNITISLTNASSLVPLLAFS